MSVTSSQTNLWIFSHLTSSKTESKTAGTRLDVVSQHACELGHVNSKASQR